MPSLRQVGHCSLASLLQPAVSQTRVSTAAMLPGCHRRGAASGGGGAAGWAGRSRRAALPSPPLPPSAQTLSGGYWQRSRRGVREVTAAAGGG